MAAKLEKQYNSEINSLSHLYHKNVIKVTVNKNVISFVTHCIVPLVLCLLLNGYIQVHVLILHYTLITILLRSV